MDTEKKRIATVGTEDPDKDILLRLAECTSLSATHPQFGGIVDRIREGMAEIGRLRLEVERRHEQVRQLVAMLDMGEDKKNTHLRARVLELIDEVSSLNTTIKQASTHLRGTLGFFPEVPLLTMAEQVARTFHHNRAEGDLQRAKVVHIRRWMDDERLVLEERARHNPQTAFDRGYHRAMQEGLRALDADVEAVRVTVDMETSFCASLCEELPFDVNKGDTLLLIKVNP